MSWSEIANPKRCPMTYTVTYNYTDCSTKEENTVNQTNLQPTSYVIMKLEPYTNYSITISANTTEGGLPGKSTSDMLHVTTEEDGKCPLDALHLRIT